jgi:hypothetical protein
MDMCHARMDSKCGVLYAVFEKSAWKSSTASRTGILWQILGCPSQRRTKGQTYLVCFPSASRSLAKTEGAKV